VLVATVKSLLRLRRAEQAHARQARLALLTADVVVALNRGGDLRDALQRCVEAVVRHLKAAVARIWTISPDGATLELQASAGIDIDLGGSHGRIPIGESMIGRIARERRPHLTNDVSRDLPVTGSDRESREGMVAFAGYPLAVEDRVLGVLAMFGRRPLAGDTFDALESVADAVALGVEYKRTEQAARRDAERIRQLEGEIRDLERLSGPQTTAETARAFGAVALRESHPDLFRELVGRYEHALDLALEQREFKVSHRISEELRSVSDRLGFSRAGPRDVVDVYRAALKRKSADAPERKGRAYVEEGRLLVLELMGHLVSYYRAASLGTDRSLSRQPLPEANRGERHEPQ
jgi:GAF domain-containing protein